MAYRAALLTALAVGVAPCAAQGIMVPAPAASPAAPASPLPSPSASMPAPTLPSWHDDPLKGFPDTPDLGSFSPQVVSWMRLRAAGLARSGEIPEAEDMPAYIRKAGIGILGNMNSEEILAIAMIVMMMAAKDAHEDLKSIMEELKKANAEKDDLDSLKLQKAMDRQSKIIRILSNLLKKRSGAASTITENIK